MYKTLKIMTDFIRSKTDFTPDIAIVLGSGLGDYGDCIQKVAEIEYKDIPGFPISTVQGHKGKFIFGYKNNKKVVAMQGRIHFYEGYTMQQSVMPIRIMKMLGAKILILSNASGGLNSSFKVGDLMVITDQILFAPSPLIGTNIEELGVRFLGVEEVYDKQLSNALTEAGVECGVCLVKGVYVQVTGPAYETPAEVRMFRMLGGDAVGMSTASEALTALHCGMKVVGVSCITDMASGLTLDKVTHEAVLEVANKNSKKLTALLDKFMEKDLLNISI